MSHDEERLELQKMLLQEHDLKRTLACLENRAARYSTSLKAGAALLEHAVAEPDEEGLRMPQHTPDLPTGEEAISTIQALRAARQNLAEVRQRISAC